MVGGLADWFAVVALFRHPLGRAHPPHRDHHRAQGAVRRDARRVHPVELPHRRRGGRAGAGRRRRRPGRPLAGRCPPTPTGWPGTSLAGAVEVVDLLEDEAVHDVLERLRARAPRGGVDRPDGGPGPRRAHPGGPPRRGRRRRASGASTATSTSTATSSANRFRDQAPWWLPGAVEDRIFERLLDGAAGRARRHGQRPAATACASSSTRASSGSSTSCRRPPSCGRKGEQLTRDLLERPELRGWVAVGVGRRQGPAARPGRRPGVRRCAQQLARRDHRRRASGCWRSRPSPPRSTTPPRRAPATWSSTSAARSPSSCQHDDRPLGRRGDLRTASSCCSAPTSSSSASTARWSAASPASASTPSPRCSGDAARRYGRPVIRAARPTTTAALQRHRAAGRRAVPRGRHARDRRPRPVRPPTSSPRAEVAVRGHRRGRRAARLRHGRASSTGTPTSRQLVGAPGARRPGDRHAAARRGGRVGAGAAATTEVTLTTFRDVPFNAPLYAKRGFEVVAGGRLDRPPSAALVAHEAGSASTPPPASSCAAQVQ